LGEPCCAVEERDQSRDCDNSENIANKYPEDIH
jgi:hypothetical protein